MNKKTGETTISKEVVVIQKEIKPIIQEAKAIEITNPTQMEKAVAVLSRLNKVIDKVTEEKERVTIPLNQALKAERSRWKPVEEMYDEAINGLRSKMSQYQTEQVRLAKEEAERIASRVGDGKGKLKIETAVRKLEEMDTPETKISTEEGIVKFRTDKKLKIVDATKIPKQYWIIDEDAVLEALKAGIVVAGAQIDEIQTPINFR